MEKEHRVGWLCLVTAAAVKPGLSYHSCGTELEEGGSSPGPEIGSGAGSRSAARGVAERWRPPEGSGSGLREADEGLVLQEDQGEVMVAKIIEVMFELACWGHHGTSMTVPFPPTPPCPLCGSAFVYFSIICSCVQPAANCCPPSPHLLWSLDFD
ncbi:hypothetical protein Anapl_03350 [Anas platyrhynchos]|uniref:Uncharacterized protein n=1 Tax=Anas platyrhynchos TaxID=8839 RepID=R0K5H2_ANAPL|nr:hypothetical protein Anapl_03350 [Anas platyrhynchos]